MKEIVGDYLVDSRRFVRKWHGKRVKVRRKLYICTITSSRACKGGFYERCFCPLLMPKRKVQGFELMNAIVSHYHAYPH